MIKNKKFLLILLILISLIRITSGEWKIPFNEVIKFLFQSDSSPQSIIIRSVRLPRILSGILTGGLLSVAGVVLQALLANPLAEPYTLGIASGAAFGASLAIMLNLMIAPFSFLGALAALLLTGLISRGGTEKLILAGVISNSILSAGVTFIKSIAGDKIGAVVLWLMGSLSGAGSKDVYLVFAGVILISMGVGLAVSSFGIIGFVGLVVPHISRVLVGASHRKLILHAFFMGACVLSIADGAAQYLGELPVGVLTALTGGPFFLMQLGVKK